MIRNGLDLGLTRRQDSNQDEGYQYARGLHRCHTIKFWIPSLAPVMDLPREQRPTRPSQSCAARLSRCTHGPGACPRMVHCDSASRGGSQSGAREGTHRVIRQQVICQLSCAQALVKIFCFICEIKWLEMSEKWRCGEPVGVHGMATIFVTLAFFPESRHESCCRRSLRVWPVVAPCFLPPPRTRGTLSL